MTQPVLLLSPSNPPIRYHNGEWRPHRETAQNCVQEWDRKSKWKWPREIPTRDDKLLWKKALQGVTTASFELTRPLGPWQRAPHQHWYWLWDPECNTLLRELTGLWYCYTSVHHRQTRGASVYEQQPIPIPTPTNLISRATVRHLGTGTARRVIFKGGATKEPPPPDEPRTIAEMIAKDANEWMFRKSHFLDEGRQIAAAMQTGTLLVVTGGSYMKDLSTKHAAAAWVMECPRTGTQCHGVIQVPGEEGDINPYRAELTGLIAVRKGLEFIAKWWQVTKVTVALRVDNQGSGSTACQVHRRMSQMNKHVDLIRKMRHINSTSSVKSSSNILWTPGR